MSSHLRLPNGAVVRERRIVDDATGEAYVTVRELAAGLATSPDAVHAAARRHGPHAAVPSPLADPSRHAYAVGRVLVRPSVYRAWLEQIRVANETSRQGAARPRGRHPASPDVVAVAQLWLAEAVAGRRGAARRVRDRLVEASGTDVPMSTVYGRLERAREHGLIPAAGVATVQEQAAWPLWARSCDAEAIRAALRMVEGDWGRLSTSGRGVVIDAPRPLR